MGKGTRLQRPGLLKAGNGVLIKFVLQAVPACNMSCFKFPKMLCKKLRSINSQFFFDKGQFSVFVGRCEWPAKSPLG
jgi:hypothetical protein